jgi:hypothetical protein
VTTFDLLLRVAFDWTAGWSHGGPFSIQTIFLKKRTISQVNMLIDYFWSSNINKLCTPQQQKLTFQLILNISSFIYQMHSIVRLFPPKCNC